MKTKHKYIAILIFLFFSINNFAQQCQWAKHFGSIGINTCAIITDNQNNIYASGIYNQKCTLTNDTLYSKGHNDIFLIKYNDSGDELWARTIGGLNPFSVNFWENIEDFCGIVFDSTNNCIYLTGNFYSSLTIDNHQITSSGDKDLFLAKFNLNGQCLWLKKAGSQEEEMYSSISTDNLGNIYFSGNLKSSGTVDSTSISFQSFLSKFTTEGNQLWTKQVLSNGIINKSIVLNNYYYFLAHFKDSTIIDTVTLYCAIDYDFIAGKYNIDNDHIEWIKQFSGGTDYDNNVLDLLFYNNGLLLYGTFNDSISINDTVLKNNGYSDIFYIKLNQSGSTDWIYQSHTKDVNQWENGRLTYGNNNTVYASGSFHTQACFGSDTILSENESAYIVRFDTTVNFIGTLTYGEAGTSGLVQLENGSFVVCGAQIDTTVIGDTVFINLPESMTGRDIYIAKFDAITGLQNIIKPNNNKLLIYANPTSGLCNISIPTEFEHEKNLILYVYDQQGRLLKQASVEMDEERIRLNMDALAKGMYTAVLSNGKKQFSGKIIFQ